MCYNIITVKTNKHIKGYLIMGWTSINATNYKNGKIDVKKELDSILYGNNSNGTAFNCLKSSLVGNIYYSACERIRDNDRVVFGLVVKTSCNMKDYYNFSYKEMDETEIPYYYDCPKNILDMLTPTKNENALEWRKCCEEKRKVKKESTLSKLPLNSEITVVMSYNSNHFKTGDKVTLVKTKWWGYKRPIWKAKGLNLKFSTNQIKLLGWEIAS